MIYISKANKSKAFTLTEVLLAVAIVGILAALVIPPIVTKFNNEVLNRGFERQKAAIKTAIDGLVVKENKKDFSETTMYSDGTQSSEETSGEFIKRYLRVSKYYGDADKNKDLITKECFASKYYVYIENKKQEYSISTYLTGACAKLKNGASLCLSPQVGAHSGIRGTIDINGPKGPNVKGKDLREISFAPISFVTRESLVSSNDVSTSVATQDDPGIRDSSYDGLCEGDYSAACCDYHYEQGNITSREHGCCSNSAVASNYPVCLTDIVLTLNLYPTTDCLYSQWSSGDCRPYIYNLTSYAHNIGVSNRLLSLPADPPSLIFYCDGVKAGLLFGDAIKSAVLSPAQSNTNVGQFRYMSTDPNYKIIQSKKCNNVSSSKGIVSGQGSFAFENGLDNIEYNGIKWWVEKY